MGACPRLSAVDTTLFSNPSAAGQVPMRCSYSNLVRKEPSHSAIDAQPCHVSAVFCDGESHQVTL